MAARTTAVSASGEHFLHIPAPCISLKSCCKRIKKHPHEDSQAGGRPARGARGAAAGGGAAAPTITSSAAYPMQPRQPPGGGGLRLQPQGGPGGPVPRPVGPGSLPTWQYPAAARPTGPAGSRRSRCSTGRPALRPPPGACCAGAACKRR